MDLHMFQVPGYCVAYCGNIAFDATAAELEEVFADCGVTQVRSSPASGSSF
jgi:hypothetical protein